MKRDDAIKALRDSKKIFGEPTLQGWEYSRTGDAYFSIVADKAIRLEDVHPSVYVKDDGDEGEVTVQYVNKYHRQLKGVTVDVYDVLKAFNVTCPATQHALKKMLCTGLRGHKDAETDLNEAIASLQRAKELLENDA